MTLCGTLRVTNGLRKYILEAIIVYWGLLFVVVTRNYIIARKKKKKGKLYLNNLKTIKPVVPGV